MNYENKDLLNKLQYLERELNGAHMAIQQYEEKQEQMLFDIQQYDQNISSLSQQLEAAHHQINEARTDRDSLLKDHEVQRNISFNLESSREELQRHIIQLENERNIIINQSEELKQEIEMLRQRLDYERSKYHQLEMILSKERMQMQQYEQENENLIREREIQSSIKKSDSYRVRSSQDYDDYDEDRYSIASSSKSYDIRNKANLQKVISQLESEIEQEEKLKSKR